MSSRIKYIRSAVYVSLAAFWLLLFVLTTLPGSSLPHFKINDKVLHFASYFILSVLLNCSLRLQNKYPAARKYSVLITLIITALYGMLDELHQELIPGREADIKDWIADMAGATLGMLFTASIFLLRRIIRFVLRPD